MPELDSGYSAERYRRQEISLRQQRRKLESRERASLFLLSGIYAYAAFGNAMQLIGFLMMGQLERVWLPLIIGSVVVTLNVFAIIKMWRKQKPAMWIVFAPAIVSFLIIVVFQAWLPIPIALNALAIVTAFVLQRTWNSIDEITAKSSAHAEILSRPQEV